MAAMPTDQQPKTTAPTKSAPEETRKPLGDTEIITTDGEVNSPDDVEEEDFPEDYPDYYPSDFNDYLNAKDATTLLQKREDTRGRLAIIYTIATFLMFVLGFGVAVLDSAIRGVPVAETLASILPLISGIFLGTLGFVLGYYFRQVEDDNTANKN